MTYCADSESLTISGHYTRNAEYGSSGSIPHENCPITIWYKLCQEPQAVPCAHNPTNYDLPPGSTICIDGTLGMVQTTTDCTGFYSFSLSGCITGFVVALGSFIENPAYTGCDEPFVPVVGTGPQKQWILDSLSAVAFGCDADTSWKMTDGSGTVLTGSNQANAGVNTAAWIFAENDPGGLCAGTGGGYAECFPCDYSGAGIVGQQNTPVWDSGAGQYIANPITGNWSVDLWSPSDITPICYYMQGGKYYTVYGVGIIVSDSCGNTDQTYGSTGLAKTDWYNWVSGSVSLQNWSSAICNPPLYTDFLGPDGVHNLQVQGPFDTLNLGDVQIYPGPFSMDGLCLMDGMTYSIELQVCSTPPPHGSQDPVSGSSAPSSPLSCDRHSFFPFAQQEVDSLLIPFWGPLVMHPGLTLPSQAGAMFWKVYAPSLVPKPVNMGPLVRASWPIRLQALEAGIVQLEREDGTCVEYQWYSSVWGYQPVTPRIFDQLTYNSETGWIETRLDTGTTFHYPAGNLVSLAYYQTVTGQRVSMIYNGDGSLGLIQGPAGRAISFSYNTDHTVSAVTDSASREFRMGYSNGYLGSIKDPTGAITTYLLDPATLPGGASGLKCVQTPDGYITTYLNYTAEPPDTTFAVQRGGVEYDYSIGAVDGVDGAVFTGGGGSIYTSVFSELGDIAEVVDPLGAVRIAKYSYRGLPVTVEDALSRTSFMVYDNNGRMTSHTNPLGETVQQGFDPNFGNLLWTLDPLGHYTSFSYFGDGSTRQLQTKTDALGGQTQYEYNSWGALAQVTTPLGRITTYNWNDDGTLANEVNEYGFTRQYFYDNAGNRTTVIDEANRCFTSTFDGMDRKLSTANTVGGMHQTQYDGAGNPFVQIDALGHRTTSQFDAFGHVTQHQDALGDILTNVYNSYQQLVSSSDPLNDVTSFYYDDANRQYQVNDPLGREHVSTFDLARQKITETVVPILAVNSMSYDLAGRVESVQVPAGQIVTNIRDAAGQIIAILDCLNLLHTNVYDALGRVSMTIAPTGAIQTMLWDADSRPTGHIDALGRQTTITYTPGVPQVVTQDPYNRLTTVLYEPSGLVSMVYQPSGRTSQNLYDGAARLQNTIDYLGLKATILYDLNDQATGRIDALGLCVTDVYSPVGKIVCHQDIYGNRYTSVYDSAQRKVNSIDPFGAMSTLTWSAASELLQTEDALGHTTQNGFDAGTGLQVYSTDQTDATTVYEYDQFARRYAVTDPDGFTTTQLFDGYGRPSGVLNARGFIVTALWDQYNRPIGHMDALGGITTLTLDLADRTTAVQNALGYRTTSAYNALDQVVQTIDANNYFTTILYDSRANKYQVTNANGHMDTVVFDGYSRPIAHVGNSGGRSTTVYDGYGRVSFESTPLGPGVTTIYDAYNRHWSDIFNDGTRVTNVYDSVGRLSITLDQKGFGVTNTYDALWRISQQEDPGGGVYNTWYSGRGEVILTADENDEYTNYYFDGRGNHIGTLLPDSSWTSQVYDQISNRIADVSSAGRYTYSFDARNKYIGHMNPIGKYDVLTLDAVGQKIGYLTPSGEYHEYAYDGVGNCLGQNSTPITMQWDGMRNLIAAQDALGSYAYEYDGHSRLTGAMAPGQSATIMYSYDLNHNLTQTYAPWGVFGFEYDPLDQLVQASDPGYPAGGIAPGVTNYTRDERGLITGQSNSNGTNSTKGFDGCRRVTMINHTLPDDSVLLAIAYTHDAAGNPLTKTTSSGDYSYQYDQLNQLIYEQTPAGSTSWTYDSAFRRIQQLDALGLAEFNYNEAGQLLTSTGARPSTCMYDDNGNTTSIETSAGLFSYAWDDLGRLSGATLPGGQILTMAYRFDNLLVSKAGPLGTQALLWDGQNVATASGPASVGVVPAATAVFVGTDTTTQGNWEGVYGFDGYNIIQDTVSYPVYATVGESGTSNNTWSSTTTDVRALQTGPSSRIAADWFSDTSFTVDINLTDGNVHQVSIYCLDWLEDGLTQTVSVVDANTSAVLNTQDVSSFQNGTYLIWNISGHVQLVFTNTNVSYYAAVSGLFFDIVGASTAVFLDTDSTTQGSWQDVYGADGYQIVGDAESLPTYADMAAGGTELTWEASTTDVRALENAPPGTGRIAACLYSDTSFLIDINLTDGKAHKISMYFLDWDTTTRSQTITVKDARTLDVLDTHDLSSFNNGVYLSWTVKGYVQFDFTNTGTPSAVVSGLFFDSFAAPPTGGYGVVAYGAGLTKTIGTDAGGNPLFRQYHTDAQGSVLAITDGQGNPVTGYQIDAWGNVLSGDAPGNAFDYLGGLGYWSDPDLGMHYVRTRWLNPQTGSWLSVDPHLDEFAYQYANNMPTTGSDPSGKDVTSDALAILMTSGPARLSSNQIKLLLRKDKTRGGLGGGNLSEEGRDKLNMWLWLKDDTRSAGSGASGPQHSGTPGKDSAPTQLRGTPARNGHSGATAGPGAGNRPRPPLTPEEHGALRWAHVDYNNPDDPRLLEYLYNKQDPAARRILQTLGDINARHVGYKNFQDPEVRRLWGALWFFKILKETADISEAAQAVGRFYSSLHIHVPLLPNIEPRQDLDFQSAYFGVNWPGWHKIALGLKTGRTAALDGVTHGNADYFGIDVNYYKGQEGFDEAALSAATGREALYFAIPVEKIALVAGRPLVALTRWGVDALKASKVGVEVTARAKPLTELGVKAFKGGRRISSATERIVNRAVKGTKAPFESKQWYINLEKGATWLGDNGARARFMRAQGAVDVEGNLLEGVQVHHAVIPDGQYGTEVPKFVKNNPANLRLTNKLGYDVLGKFGANHEEIDFFVGSRQLTLPIPLRTIVGAPVVVSRTVTGGLIEEFNYYRYSRPIPIAEASKPEDIHRPHQ